MGGLTVFASGVLLQFVCTSAFSFPKVMQHFATTACVIVVFYNRFGWTNDARLLSASATSTGSLQGLDNTNGGVCRTKTMKMVLRVGQSSSDPRLTLQESPTRFSPTKLQPKTKDAAEDYDIKNKTDAGSEAGQLNPGGGGGSPPGLLIWVVSACVILLLLLVAIPSAVLCKCRRCVPDRQQSASVSLNTLAVPKRDSISSDNVGSDRSEIVFPPQASDSRLCRHFERLSGEYGAPVYIVKEITPQSPTNIYYKV